MKLVINSYPKCECGNDMVPLYFISEYDKSSQQFKEIEKSENLFWECPKCGKRIAK